ncbi:hypothetical protein FBY35_4599 [Streptomyces sp. SLBN-118]|nr:hypothetical protein FBY35_4599 [Streptomyces sp. SLBN-118]
MSHSPRSSSPDRRSVLRGTVAKCFSPGAWGSSTRPPALPPTGVPGPVPVPGWTACCSAAIWPSWWGSVW